MKKNFSIYLDVVGFCAVMTVAASHFVYLRWTGGAIPERIFLFLREAGADAVMVLFVLLAFVIACSADQKDRDWRDYAFARATRIYAVVVPAVIFVIFLDAMGKAQNPAAYDGWWYADHRLWAALFRGLTFSNEFWTSAFRMGSNGPYWALGYGIWYCVLFGVAFYARGWSRVLLFTAIALMIGPKIWLLAPVWMLGFLLYRAVKRGWLDDHEGPTALAKELVAVVAPVVIYSILRFSDFNNLLNDASVGFIALFHEGRPGHAHFFLWHWFVGVLVLVHFAGVGLLLQRVPAESLASFNKPMRWLAGASFSIYLLHYPLLQFFGATMAGEASDPMRAFFLFVLVIGASFIFAEISERRLRFFRRSLKRGTAALRRRLDPLSDDASYDGHFWR